ncbi:MAG: hypothetical protein LUC92_01720 [Clostridiales bacterium]|nr:hypothetical protein [Clostridiales bacterium]
MSYNIYITKSSDAADLIAQGLLHEANILETDGITVSHGCTDGKEIIPVIFQSPYLYYACMEYPCDNRASHYSLIVC